MPQEVQAMPLIVTTQTTAKIRFEDFNPYNDLLACTLDDESIVYLMSFGMGLRRQPPSWQVLVSLAPEACTSQFGRARAQSVSFLEAMSSISRDSGRRSVGRIEKLKGSEAVPTIFVQATPDIGVNLLVHISYIDCRCKEPRRGLLLSGCVSVKLGKIKSLAGTTRTKLGVR